MADPYEVREAVMVDIDPILDLWLELLDYHASFDPRYRRSPDARAGFAVHLREYVDATDRVLLVADADGEVIGFTNGLLAKYPPCLAQRDHGYLDHMVIAPAWRRTGVGTALLDRAMAWFAAQGVPTVETRIHLSNPMVRGFVEKAGFEPYMLMLRRPPAPSEPDDR